MARVERVPATLRSSCTKVLAGTTLTLLVATSVPSAAAALAPSAWNPPTTNVSTDPTGAHVHLGRGGVWIEIRGPRDGDASRRWRRDDRLSTTLGADEVPQLPQLEPGQPRHPPDSDAAAAGPGVRRVLRVLRRGLHHERVASSERVRAGCRRGRRARDRRAARRAIFRIPTRSIHISPDARGLTGLESWFWVTGYTGVIRDAVDEFGIRVEVEAQPGSVSWNFGDETPTQSGTLGHATPARSDVAHTYEQRSKGDAALGPGNRAAGRALPGRRRAVADPGPRVPHRGPRLSRRRVARRARPVALTPGRAGSGPG